MNDPHRDPTGRELTVCAAGSFAAVLIFGAGFFVLAHPDATPTPARVVITNPTSTTPPTVDGVVCVRGGHPVRMDRISARTNCKENP